MQQSIKMKKEEKARKERRKSKIVAFFGSYYLAIWCRDNSKREEEGEEEAEGKGRGRKRILIWKLCAIEITLRSISH